ncbi:Hsp20/alpha crystallin family protein [Desulfoferrobacter suflitae]|uniref:Hsp20/alpha crystallin family protein n=1 Tax=Desulfoferrobacter suflitae TaxID=2865782 RepID=UPI002164A9E5|nr:Hsp20/alpha crystallin family protein [Desulfoferrobacter suflitae]MCK8600467.1 Hsp20/alpha crystallin family protein [Desulfoferrobacter suflitae]
MSELVPCSKRLSPLSPPASDLSDRIDRLFDDMVPSKLFARLMPSMRSEAGEWMPEFDISETDDQIIGEADVPGVDPKDLELSISPQKVLSVRAEKREKRELKDECQHCIERRFGAFSRSFTLPREVYADEVEATYKDGVLKLTIPKTESSRSKKITVDVG